MDEATKQEYGEPANPQELPVTVKAALRELGAVLAAKGAVEQQEAAQIKACRNAGASWEKIAREYGITRQAVFQKWSKKV